MARFEWGPVPRSVGQESRYSRAPRRAYVMVHHAGFPNAHQDNTSVYCDPNGVAYDWQIRWDGAILTCSVWDDTVGQHARGCNCQAIGIVLMGCFGGSACQGGSLLQPSNAQECSLAYLISHLGTADIASRYRPHANCFYWNPCASPNPTATVCCGTNLTTTSTTNNNWNTAGVAFRDRVRAKRRPWDLYGSCSQFTPGCPL